MRIQKLLGIILSALLLLALVSCGKKAAEPTAAQAARRDALAQAFMEDIRDKILPVRTQPALIGAQGVLISEEEEVDNFSVLEAFWEDYQAGEDCALTVCFITKGFVAARFIVEDGTGYYFRYQYSATEPIAVTPRLFDSISVNADGQTGKTLLELKFSGDKDVTFTFREKREDGMPPDPQ